MIADDACPRTIPRLRPRHLHEPLLKALGRATKLTPNTFVEHKTLLDDVIREAGFDPANLPSGWSRKNRSGNGAGAGLDRNISLAFRYAYRNKRTPLTVKGPQAGLWGLTVAGVDAANALTKTEAQPEALTKRDVQTREPTKPKGPNVTSRWLTKHLMPERGQQDSELMRMMRSALSRHLPVSARIGQIDDHVNNFMVRMIRRDAFRKHLENGSLPLSKVVAYCVNSGRTDARDMGTDPVCREMYGARTERERKLAAARPRHIELDKGPMASLDTDGNIIDPDATATPDVINTADDFERIWKRIEAIVEEKKPQAWERYSGILAMRAQDYTTQEIADAEGVSRNRAASMLAEARKCVRDAADEGQLDGYLF